MLILGNSTIFRGHARALGAATLNLRFGNWGPKTWHNMASVQFFQKSLHPYHQVWMHPAGFQPLNRWDYRGES